MGGGLRLYYEEAGEGDLTLLMVPGWTMSTRVFERQLAFFEATEGWPADAPVLCRVKMINEFPLIPHLEQLEAMLAAEAVRA